MTFRVGQKVVCVNAKGGGIGMIGQVLDTNEIVKGAVYTVRWSGMYGGQPSVRLEEVIRGHLPGRGIINGGEDVPWIARRFRPLVENKTDISFAHDILRAVSDKIGERA